MITWEQARRDTEEEPWHYRWRYELVPGEGRGTDVTKSFDLSHSPEAARQAARDGTVWIEAITETLERLEDLCSQAGRSQAG